MYMYKKEEKTGNDNLALFEALIMSFFMNATTDTLWYMDLHSMSVEQAKIYVFKHVRNASAQGMSCCRIITGRGNHVNAKGERGVIFDACEAWLESDELKPLIEQYEKKIGHYIVKLKSPKKEFNDIKGDEQFFIKYIAEVQEKAAKNDAEAQYELGCFYAKGFGRLKSDPKVAFKWYLTAAKQGHEKALAQVGHLYLTGEGVKQSDQLATEWLIKAADKGNARSAYTLSSIYLWGWGTDVNHKLAIVWAAKSANWGDVMGMRRVGGFYYHGSITAKNDEQAFKWYFKAATLGDEYSQYQLGIFYSEGIGIAQDLKKGFEWLLLAARGGDIDAMMMVGRSYLDGKGCKKNIKEGLEWLHKADSFSHVHASFFIGEYYLKQNKMEEALNFFEKSAEVGSILAQAELSRLKLDNGVEQDKILALLMEQPVIEITQKLPLAIQTSLGSLLLEPAESKSKTKKNQKKGVVILELAARAGYVIAYNELGFHFARSNLKKAAEYWEKGVGANSADALFMYGLYLKLYEQNSEDNKKAITLFKKAAEVNHPGALFLLGIEELFGERLKDEELEKTPNYLMLAVEQGNQELKSKEPGFISSYMALYKALHAIGVFLIYMDSVIPEESLKYKQQRLAAYQYWRQSASMGYNKAQFDLGIGLVQSYESFQEGIDWLSKAAEQGDKRAEQAVALYKTYENLPQFNLPEFNVQLTAIIQQTFQEDQMGFSKKDFNALIEAHFGNYINLLSSNSSKKKEDTLHKTEKVTPRSDADYLDKLQTSQEGICNSPKKASELIIMHSSLFKEESEKKSSPRNANMSSNSPTSKSEEKEPEIEQSSALGAL